LHAADVMAQSELVIKIAVSAACITV
jgi:hypothetical protein